MSSAATGATGLAARYAAALFDLAEEKGELDRVAEDLGRLAALTGESADLRRLIRSPLFSRADQKTGIDAVMKQAKIGPLARNFVGLAATNRRLAQLPDMIGAFRARLADRAGETTAHVTSAKPLSKAQADALQKTLEKSLGAKVAVEARVDPGLFGGLVVKVGSRMVDASLRSRLNRLRLAMKGTG
ncbi:MAG: F0F1 ATP synthase subunit delta [Alphaproteobacteria bacterium]|nr:F0F1 ATP synthase subunit delta [Alphaproteobacteria bacterium]